MTKEKLKSVLLEQYESLQTSITREKNFTYTKQYAELSVGERFLFAEQYKLEMKLLDVIEARLSLM